MGYIQSGIFHFKLSYANYFKLNNVTWDCVAQLWERTTFILLSISKSTCHTCHAFPLNNNVTIIFENN